MSRGVDLSTITRAERLVFSTGLALFVDAVVPWWYRIRTPDGTFLHNGGLRGWGVLAAAAGFAAALVVLARRTQTPASFDDRAIYFVLGLLGLAAAIVQGLRASSLWIGYWVGLALAGALLASAALRLREKRRGWI